MNGNRLGGAGSGVQADMNARGESLSTGELLRRYRLLAGLTQEELAERSGYSVHYVSKLERDERRPPRAALERLAAVLILGEDERSSLWAAVEDGIQGERTGALLAGRTREVGEIRRQLAGLGPPVLLFSGEPGIGKTRLLEEAAALATESGWRVIQGGCQRRAQDPYAPLTDALAGAVERLPPAERQTAIDHAGQLDLLLPELGVTDGEILPDGPPRQWAERVRRSDQERRVRFAAVGRFLRGVAGNAGTLLILDDLQWAGADAFDLLTTVVAIADTPPVRLIAAYRDSETAPDAPLGSFIADLARTSLVRVLPLGPLSDAEAETLVSDLVTSGAENRAVLPAIVRRAGGVPFFLVSYLEDLQAHGGAESDLDLPWNVSQVILQRVVALPRAVQEVLRVAAVVGRAVTAALLRRVVDLSEEEVLEALDAASRARILHEDDEGRYHFTHDLIRESIEGELSGSRRRQLHRRIGEALEREPRTAMESLAFHFDLSDDGDRAVRYLERAGDGALQRFAHTAAADFYRKALDWVERSDGQHDVAAIQEKWGIALYQSGQYDKAIAALERSLEGYRAGDDTEGVDRATGRLADAHFRRGTGQDALEQVTRLVERGDLDSEDGASPGAFALREGLIRLLYSQGSFSRLLTVGRSLRRVGRVTGNRRMQTMGTRAEGSALVFLGRLREGTAMIESTIPADISIDRDRRVTEVANVATVAYYIMGATESSRVLSARMLHIAESMNDAAEIGSHSLLTGAALHVAGEWEQAHTYLDRAHEQFAASGPSAVSVRMAPILADCLIREGRWDEARQHLKATLQTARSMHAFHPERTALTLLALVDLLEGRPQATIARLGPLVTDDLGWAYAVTLLFTLAEAYLEIGDVDRAQPLAERAVSEARRMEAWLPGIEALRVLGMAEMRRRNDDIAGHALDEGLQRSRAMPFPYAEARILHASGLLDEQQGDTTSSRAKLSQALAIMDRLGAVRKAQRFSTRTGPAIPTREESDDRWSEDRGAAQR